MIVQRGCCATISYATSYYATSSYATSSYATTSEAKLSFFLSTLFNLHAPYPVAPHLHAQIAYSSPATKLFDGSSLNVALDSSNVVVDLDLSIAFVRFFFVVGQLAFFWKGLPQSCVSPTCLDSDGPCLALVDSDGSW